MPEKVIVVIAAPQSDRPTKVSSAAGKELYKIVKQCYPQVEAHFIPEQETLHENSAVIQEYAKKGNVLFSYFGHGERTKLCGIIPPNCRSKKRSMVNPENVKVLKNVVCHATACWTSVGIGPLAEDIGAAAYLGSRAPCYVAFNLTEAPYMTFIHDVWHQFPITLLNGGTVAQGIKAMEDKTRYYEDLFFDKKEEWSYADYYKVRFRKNMDILVPYGNLRARLVA